ncbi:hypothetical protein FQR65_LT15207 [Abscondita terminalis]|nr:hypothetical protein FQR65_LT15207 [Abscondita terminalis]
MTGPEILLLMKMQKLERRTDQSYRDPADSGESVGGMLFVGKCVQFVFAYCRIFVAGKAHCSMRQVRKPIEETEKMLGVYAHFAGPTILAVPVVRGRRLKTNVLRSIGYYCIEALMQDEVNSYEEFKDVLENKGGFISCHWDGTVETEKRVKEETKATIRCVPLDAKEEEGVCIFTGTPGPQDSFLALRGIKTLHLRMEAHCANGRRVAEFLKNHPKVETIYWPGFEEHPGHEIAKKQMRDFGGMISIVLKGADMDETFRISSRFKVFTLAESLGGVESLINHPATMTHGSVPKEAREKVGVVDNLLRLSVGIEDAEIDLIEDAETRHWLNGAMTGSEDGIIALNKSPAEGLGNLAVAFQNESILTETYILGISEVAYGSFRMGTFLCQDYLLRSGSYGQGRNTEEAAPIENLKVNTSVCMKIGEF